MAENENNYILLYHRNPEVITLKDFMEREYIYGITPDDLFKQNKEYIWSQMSDADKKRIFGKQNATIDDLKVDTELPLPCKIKINPKLINAVLSISQTNLQEDLDDFYVFESKEIEKVLNTITITAGDYVEKTEPRLGVYIWCKSQYRFSESNSGDNYQFHHLSDKFLNGFQQIDYDIISISTRVGEEGGSFTLRLPVVPVSVRESSLYNLDEKRTPIDIIPRKKYGVGGSTNEKHDLSSAEMNYYSNLISSNDLIFISFNKINPDYAVRNEGTVENVGDNEFEVRDFHAIADLSNENFDMIGLVDSVRTVVEHNNAYIEVTGRDLMKLLIDDGSFFFMPSTCSYSAQVFANELGNSSGDINSIDETNPLNRLRLPAGEIDLFARTTNKDISFILKGIISKLANIEVCPTSLFNEWGDKRTRFLDLQPDKQ